MSANLIHLLLTITLVIAAGQAGAEIYQWKDEHGQTVFSEKPPAGTAAAVVKPKTAPPSAAAIEKLKAQSAAPTVAADAEKKVATKPPEPTVKEAAANCAKAREVLSQLQTQNRLHYKQENGELGVLTEDQREERIKDSQASIASWCN